MKKGILSILIGFMSIIFLVSTAFATYFENPLKAKTVLINPTTQAPKFVSGFKTDSMGKDSQKAAKEFLQQHFDYLKIDTLMLGNVEEIEIGNMNHVKFQQIYKAIPVERAEILVHMTTKGKIVGLSSNYQPDLDLDVTPKITADKALSTVMQDLGVDPTKDEPTVDAKIQLPDPNIAGIMVPFYGSFGLENPLKPTLLGPELVIYPYGEGEKKDYLSWKISYSGKDVGSWIYFVDADTGEIISIQDARINYSTRGTYQAKYFPTDGDDTLATAPLIFSDVSSYYYWSGWNLYDTDTSSSTGYYKVYYPNGYYWYQIGYHLYGPKCWAIHSGNLYDSVYSYFPYYQIPYTWNFTWNEDPYNYNSLFDSQNVCWHINNSLYNFYWLEEGFDLGYQIKCFTHVNSPLGPHYDGIDRTLNFTHDMPPILRNSAWARDVMLHELQHAVTHKIYDPYYLGNDVYELALNETFSDYFSCAQTEDPDQGEWFMIDPNMRRHLDIRRNMSQWDPNVYHKSSQIYSSALWDIRENRGFSSVSIDNLSFKHLYWKPKNFLEACNIFMEEAEIQGYTTPQTWIMNYVFARQGITPDFLWETFSDGASDGWQSLSGLWHVSSYRAFNTPYSLAYNQQPPTPPNYDVGTTSGDAILEIEHLDEFDSAILYFAHWYQTECGFPCPWDIMKFSISTNDGVSWKDIFDSSDTNLWDTSWTSGTWNVAQYDFLPSELISSILIKFSFDSTDDLYNNYEGWYIDDIKVETDGPMYY